MNLVALLRLFNLVPFESKGELQNCFNVNVWTEQNCSITRIKLMVSPIVITLRPITWLINE